jgi:hypothetical protein
MQNASARGCIFAMSEQKIERKNIERKIFPLNFIAYVLLKSSILIYVKKTALPRLGD